MISCVFVVVKFTNVHAFV